MPIYLDYHQLDGFTIEEIKEAHKRDVKTQNKHGVRFIQYWMNEQNATVFCLVEGPNKEACLACHLEAKNGTPCNIQEVSPVFLKTFMGDSMKIEGDMTLLKNGMPDPGIRTIMVIDFNDTGIKNLRNENETARIRNRIAPLVAEFKGRFITDWAEPGICTIVFDTTEFALGCAKSFEHFKGSPVNFKKLKIAIGYGPPLTKENGLFELVMKQTRRICMIAEPGQILLSAQLKGVYDLEREKSNIRLIFKSEERFLHKLFDLTEDNLQSTSFNVNKLCRLIGMSRPQLYRKVSSLIGLSPKAFIQLIKMNKALDLIMERNDNISLIAYELGYSNPSHFSKVFRQCFGYSPSQLKDRK